jgi:hypothetical protein
MKVTSVLSLAVALCVVSVQAAPVEPNLAISVNKAKVTTTTPAAKPKATTTTPAAKPKPKATTTTVATPKPTTTPPKKDPCSELAAQGKNSDSILKFKTVRDCYRAQKFNKEIADKTLASVEGAIGNFYVFLDQAKEASKAPFKTPKVDLMAGLKKIRATKWKNDYDFNMALTYLTFSANDGHLAYRSKDLFSVI